MFTQSIKTTIIWNLIFLFTPFFAVRAVETQIFLSGKTIPLEGLKPETIWPTLKLSERRLLVPYLVDYYSVRSAPQEKKQLLKILNKQQDPFLLAYARIADAYFHSPSPKKRRERLETAENRQSAKNYKNAIQFHLYLQLWRSGKTHALKSLRKFCRLPAAGCRLVELTGEVERLLAARRVRQNTFSKMMRLLALFLAADAKHPPFYREIAGGLPDKLHALGFPLEAAILTERMTDGDPSPAAQQLRTNVALYLGGAGDFHSALRFMSKGDDQYLPLRLNWLLLGGRYQEAIQLITQHGPAKFVTGGVSNVRDYWSGYAHSPESIRLRLAVLLYLAGDNKKAVKALDQLAEKPMRTAAGEPVNYFARLRLAQTLLQENPKLAHKIAEDIAYLAQEKDWEVLEYHATVLDGWANYFLKKHFRAVVNFTKAGGILTGKRRRHASEYSRLLGLLSANNKLRAGKNQGRLIQKIYRQLRVRPYNQAVSTLSHWTPVFAEPGFFLKQAMLNFHAGKRDWDALNFLIEYFRTAEYFFKPGYNPGGLRGLPMSVLWSAEQRDFMQSAGLRNQNGKSQQAVAAYVRERLVGKDFVKFSPKSFKRREFYLLSFALEKDRLVYLVYPGKETVRVKRGGKRVRRTRKTMKVARLRLKPNQVAALLGKCRFGGRSDCKGVRGYFQSFRKLLGGKSGVNGRYAPQFDVDYGALLSVRSRPRATEYFYGLRAVKGIARLSGKKLQVLRGCEASALAGGVLQRDLQSVGGFVDFFVKGAGGVWLWPTGLDARVSSSGKERPVYLRRFLCGERNLRFWDLDRFSQGLAPGLLVYERRQDETRLDRAFLGHFAAQGGILLELDAGRQKEFKYFYDVLKGSRVKSASKAIRGAYVKMNKRYPGARNVRLIFPGPSAGGIK